jgi:phosphatidylserine/phosphatidylglycerophosphate/cardiolipin synthase-like enzyme
MTSMDEHVFPQRAGNEFHLLVDGDRFYPAMLQAVEQAQHYILMEMYLVESGRVADLFCAAFIAAAQRGVCVQLLLDAFGARGFSRRDRERLLRSGVQLASFNPLSLRHLKGNLLRTHRKYLLADATVVFVGGSGIADFFSGPHAWRETMVAARGPVVSDWHALFAADWRRWSGQPVPEPRPVPHCTANVSGRVVWTAGGTTRLEIKRNLINRARGAVSRVWLASAYFVPSRKVRRALRRAAARGVDARLLLPGPVTDHPAVRFAGRRFYARLLRYGVRIFEYQHRFMHTKLALVDDWCSIGSSNMDRWNLRWNLEANQEIFDAGFAGEASRMLQADFAHSREIHYREWQRRSLLHRLMEWLWGKIDIRLAQWRPHIRDTARDTPERSPDSEDGRH